MAIDDTVALIQVKLGHLAVERDRDAYLRGLADLAAQAVDAERCTFYHVDQEKGEVWARIARPIPVEIRLPIGRGIAGIVAQTGETINVPDAYANAQFDRDVDLRIGYRTRNILAVPIWSADRRRVIGVIQVLNKRAGTFERRDQMSLERIADGVAPTIQQIALEHA